MQPAEKQVEVGEFTMNYATGGSGDPVVLLHGSEPGESWSIWEQFFALTDTYRVVAPDLIGHGKSSKPTETPDHRVQARALSDLLEKLSLERAALIGAGWGGQVALEFAIGRPESVASLVLIASAYDKDQLRLLGKLRRPTLIVYAEDDMVTQLKAGYLLRDAIGTSRLEVLDAVAKDPRYDFRMSHRLQNFRAPQVLQLVRTFLSDPGSMVAEPPELENELRGMALRKEDDEAAGGTSGTP